MPKIVKNKQDEIKQEIVIKNTSSDYRPFFVVGLFLTSLMMISIACFSATYGYPFFDGERLKTEVFIVVFYFLFFSALFIGLFFPLIWLISKKALSILASFAVYLLLRSLFEINLVYSPNEIFVHYFSRILGSGFAGFIGSYVSFLIASVIAFSFWFSSKTIKKNFIEAATAINVVLFLIIISNLHNVETVRIEEKKVVEDEASEDERNQNLIYLIFNGHGSHSYLLENYQNHKMNKDYKLSLIDGFYHKFGFKFYPHSYSISNNNIFSIVSALNFEPNFIKEKEKYLNYINDIYYYSYLKKGEDNKPKYTLSQNALFERMFYNGYKINVYQTKYLDFCRGVGENLVSKCVTFHTYPAIFNNGNVSSHLKALNLIGHWFYAHKMAERIAFRVESFLKKLAIPTNRIPLLGEPLNESYPANQLEMLDSIKDDILNAKGKNVFFAYIMLPSHPYIFDEFCQVKPDFSWQTLRGSQSSSEGAEDLLSETQQKKAFSEYMKQMSCLYGKLDSIFTEFYHNNVLDKSIVVMHGDVGSKVNRDIYNSKDNYATVFAVYEPNKQVYEVDTTGCDVTTLVSSFFSRDDSLPCVETVLNLSFQTWSQEYPLEYDFFDSREQYNDFIDNFKKHAEQEKERQSQSSTTLPD